MNLSGSVLGKYQLIERLGQGGMAQVYRAVQPTIDRQVAIKVLHSYLVASPGFVDRFKREARGLGQLHHPHIVQIIDFDVQDELYYMVMDFIPGKTLRAHLDERGAMAAAETLAIAEQLAGALAYAHKRGVIHRDVKPSNVLFRDEACTDAVLTDFGIGRLMDDATMTMSGSVIGTPAYMSPEAALGQRVDARADLYSLGIIMYEMVTGQVPYSGDTPLSVIMKQVHEPLPPLHRDNAGMPEALVQIIDRLLEKDVANRYQSADEVTVDVHAARVALAGQSVVLPGQVTRSLTTSISAAASARDSTQSPGATAVRTPTPPPAAPAAPPHAPTRTHPAPEPTGPSWRWPAVAAVLGALLLLIIGAFTLGGRMGGQAAATPAPTGATAAAQATLAPAPTADSGPATADTAPRPTAAAPLPTATAAPLPLVPAGSMGALEFADGPEQPAGQFLLRLDRVPLPPPDSQYHLWLQAGDTAPRSFGPLTPEAGRVVRQGDLEANMIAPGSRVLVSLEPADAVPAAPGEQVVFAGALPDDYAAAMRRVLLADSGGPGSLNGALDQARVADEHAGFAREALATGDLTMAQRHAEHVVNILDGAEGQYFGDLNQDGQAENPGDNVGVRVYLERSRERIEAALAAGEPTGERQLSAAGATDAIASAQALIEQAIESARAIVGASDVAEATQVAELLVEQIGGLIGRDDQGTIGAAYSHALRLAAIPMLAQDPQLPSPDALAETVPGRVGTLSLVAVGTDAANNLHIDLAQLAPLPPGYHYDAWLVGETGEAALLLGQLELFNQYGRLASRIDLDSLGAYDRVVVSIERDGEPNDAPGATLVYTGALPAVADRLVSQLLGDPATAAGPLFSAGEQAGIAEEHLQLARESRASGDLATVQRHMEHVVNILDGADGVFFGDLNFDGQAENPGDNIGTRGHLVRVADQLQQLQQQGELATGNQQFYVDQMLTNIEFDKATIEATIDRAKKVLASDSLDESARFIDETAILLGQVLNGRDSDGNGVRDPLMGEGGVSGLAALAVAVDEVDIFPVNSAAARAPRAFALTTTWSTAPLAPAFVCSL